MNKKLAIFVNDDYLVAAIEPLKEKFTVIGDKEEKKFYLYFYINPNTSEIDYGKCYKTKFRDNQNLYAGDIMQALEIGGKKYNVGGYSEDYITLFQPVIKNIKNFYYNELKKYDQNETNIQQTIETEIVFNDNISPKSRQLFINYWQSNGFKITESQTIDILLIKYYMSQKGGYIDGKKYAILETLGNDLNMSIVETFGTEAKRLNFKKFEGYGIDPRVSVIAKKIVDDVNRQEGLLSMPEDIKKEYIRHYDKALKIIDYLSKKPKNFIRLDTTFAVDPTKKIVVNLSLEEINKLSYLYSRQFSAFFTDSFLNQTGLRTIDLERIFLVGNTLENEMVQNEFSRFGNGKIETIGDDISFVLHELFKEKITKQEIDEEATMFLPNSNNTTNTPPPFQPNKTKQQNVYQEVDKIQISLLPIGRQVLVNTFDPKPNKGAAKQELKYIGNGSFKVIASTRSLQPGDEAVPLSDIWKTGMQIDFYITRGGKNIGTFRTRPVVKLSLK